MSRRVPTEGARLATIVIGSVDDASQRLLNCPSELQRGINPWPNIIRLLGCWGGTTSCACSSQFNSLSVGALLPRVSMRMMHLGVSA